MDNITHCLVGAFSAEILWALISHRESVSVEADRSSQDAPALTHETTGDPGPAGDSKAPSTHTIQEANLSRPLFSSRARLLFYLSALLSSNLPDFDILLGFILEPRRLQYLLQHRGHTHTVFAAPLQAGLVVLIFWLWGKVKKAPLHRLELVGVAALALLSLFLHLVLDGLNQYGVHPFWPLDNRWFYGDMIFIVEPWIWITLLPPLFFAAQHRYTRVLLVSLLVAALGLLWFSGYVPWPLGLGVTCWGLLLAGVLKGLGSSARLILSGAILLLVLLLFGLESRWLRENIRERFEREQPGVTVNDVILSPFPANPICWQVVTVETLSTRVSFKLRRGVVSIYSNLYAPEECLAFISKKADYQKNHPQVVWTSELRFSRVELKRLFKTNCFVRAQMKFLRAPFWYRKAGKLFLSDLRFEMGDRANFTAFEIPPEGTQCPEFVPPWIEPRADLLAE